MPRDQPLEESTPWVSWRWMFLVNLPVGAAAVGLGLRNLPAPPATPPGPLDWRGLALLPPALAALVLGTSLIGPGALPASVVVLYAVGAALVATFVVHALRAPAPLLDLRLFRDRLAGGATAVLFLYTGATMAGLILMPLHWQSAQGEPALTTGLLMAPAAVVTAAVIRLSGTLIDSRTPPLLVIGGGIGVSLIAQAGLAVAFTANAPNWIVVALWALRSLGAEFVIMPGSTTAVRHLTSRQVPSGTTAFPVSAQIAAAACVAIVSVLLAARLNAHLPPGQSTVAELATMSPADRAQVLEQVTAAFGDVSWLPTLLMALAGILALIVFRGIPAPHTRRGAALEQATDHADPSVTKT